MNKTSLFIGVTTAIAVTGVTAYVLIKNKDLREKAQDFISRVMQTSIDSVNEMTEEAALKTARATKNPKINQTWVENQWKMAGYN